MARDGLSQVMVRERPVLAFGQCYFVLANLPVGGSPSNIRRASIQLYQHGAVQIIGTSGEESLGAVQEIVGDGNWLWGSDK